MLKYILNTAATVIVGTVCYCVYNYSEQYTKEKYICGGLFITLAVYVCNMFNNDVEDTKGLLKRAGKENKDDKSKSSDMTSPSQDLYRRRKKGKKRTINTAGDNKTSPTSKLR